MYLLLFSVMLVPDFERNTVTVTLLGRNLCGLDGVERKRDEPFEMKHGTEPILN